MWDISILTCNLGKCFSEHTLRQLNAKLLQWRSWAQHHGSSAPQPSSQTSTPAAPFALAQVQRTCCTRTPHSHAFHMANVLPLLIQSTCRHTIRYVYCSKAGVAQECTRWRYFCHTFKLFFFGSWLNLADFSQKLRRICSAHSACPATGTIASRQPHEVFKITQQFLLWPSVHGIRLKCF